MVMSHVLMVMSHVVPCAYANCLFTYVNEISLQVRVRELPCMTYQITLEFHGKSSFKQYRMIWTKIKWDK